MSGTIIPTYIFFGYPDYKISSGTDTNDLNPWDTPRGGRVMPRHCANVV